MNDQLVDIFVLSLFAMLNPSLLAALTVMLLLPGSMRLMVGYLLGAYLTSIAVGLLIVFSLHGSSAAGTAKHTLSPLEDIVVALIALTVAFVLRTGRDQPIQQRRRERKEAKLNAKREAGKPTESLPIRMLGRGDPRVAFAVGVLLSFPGVSYLAALSKMAKLDAATVPTALLVVGFCVIQLAFLEVPLLGYVFAPEASRERVTRFKVWMSRSGRRLATTGAAAIGVLLLARGVITLL
ncbi:MAG: GAP family protein [Thermoleophilaceae bacterium]|jgi:hypothetical protein